MADGYRSSIGKSTPTWRTLRIYSYDPSLALRHASMDASTVTVQIPWETKFGPGPEGEYLQIVDIDPPSNCAYAPIDLNDADCLATNGLDPSESNPQFHQQMVYAVAMSTIGHFERALGRVALWSDYDSSSAGAKKAPDAPKDYSFVRRLRIYPHALREQNAYYSSAKKSVLFGYFPVERTTGASVAGTLVFTCLSHDIIAHEVTHALLDGAHHYFAEPANGDVLAFHEAFSDIVAIFQHFSYPGILRGQISRTRGDLERESFLGQLAQQFGDATGRGDALRSYLGGVDPETKKWTPKPPDPTLMAKTSEAHGRGAILVAAVFGAFTKVYNRRTADLYRLATEGTGVLRAGDIHPDLVDRLADEAQKTAEYLLQMCIRGLDYCPPVGITFGDYLRGVITGDYDYFPDDRYGFRVAMIESFRQWGIYPQGMRSMSVESLLWPTAKESIFNTIIGDPALPDGYDNERHLAEQTDEALRGMLQEIFAGNSIFGGVNTPSDSHVADTGNQHGDEVIDVVEPGGANPQNRSDVAARDRDDRFEVWKEARIRGKLINQWIYDIAGRKSQDTTVKLIGKALGFVVKVSHSESKAGQPLSIRRRRQKDGQPDKDWFRVQINSVRIATRRDRIRSWPRTDFVLEVVQTREGYFDRTIQARIDAGTLQVGDKEYPAEPDFKFRAGCTLVIDPVTATIRRVIKTASRIDDDSAFHGMRRFIETGMFGENAFAPGNNVFSRKEQFAALHSHGKHNHHGF